MSKREYALFAALFCLAASHRIRLHDGGALDTSIAILAGAIGVGLLLLGVTS